MRLELNIKATQTVTPQIIATMTMLQYGAQELEDYLSDLSYENPMMEVEKPQVSDEELARRLRFLGQGSSNQGTYYESRDQKFPELPSLQKDTLAEYLKDQICTLELPKGQLRAMETVAELLTDRGYFDGTIEEICRLSGCDQATAEAALEEIRSLEPAGVGARDVKDCLLLQLRRMVDRDDVAETMITDYFEKLATWDAARFARELAVTEEEANEAKLLILSLSPNPGDGFSTQETTVYIRPDLVIRPEGDSFKVEPVEETVPKVSVNGEYLKLLEEATDPEVRKYLRQKLIQVEQVMRNLSNRSSTMVRCGQAVAEWQAEFFSGGDLKKMTLRDIAGELGVHESTVCRTVKHKYIACDRGLLSMSSLFSRDAGQNIGVSRRTIQKLLSEIIREEPSEKPLSDEKLAGLLEDRGIRISRRTVAKYRMELGIPTASKRKRK